MSTKVLAVKTALRVMLDASTFLTSNEVQVTYGFPTRAPQRKWAYVGEAVWQSAEWVSNRIREETFTIGVTFNVQAHGQTAEEAEAYVIQMATEFEDSLRANPSLGGLCVTTGFNPKALRCWPLDQAFEAQYETEVRAVCRP